MADSRHAAKNPPRRTCPKCGRDVAVRRGGELREHRKAEGGQNPLCAASGLTPTAAAALMEAGKL